MAQNKWLFQPLDKTIYSQLFGENKTCIDIATGKKYKSCDGLNPPAGYKSMYSKMKGHNGLDMITSNLQPIYSAQDGIVTFIETEPERGLGIRMQTERKHWCNETLKEEYFNIAYWHNAVNLVKKGDKVKIGQLIALADSTGLSTGPHLHFAVKPVTKSGKNILQDNGYFGAVDPKQYMLDEKASTYRGWKTWQERLALTLFRWFAKTS